MEQPVVLQWFIQQIEIFAPETQRAERQLFYQTLHTLQPSPSTTLYDNVALFVLAQLVAAQQLVSDTRSWTPAERSSAHDTWYAKERQRIAKCLMQIVESPVVSTFQAAVTYYDAAEVTCEHGRNQKTCEALYALGLTLRLLEQYPGSRWVRKQVERLRQREPHLPPLNDLCAPLAPVTEDISAAAPETAHDAPASGTPSPDDLTSYLLGTMAGRLRHVGLTVGQSCTLVDRALHCCFGRPDPSGARPAVLAVQWRRLNQQNSGA